MAHALDALKARLGLTTNYTPELDHIYGAQWSHLTPSEKNLFNRLSGYVQSTLTAGRRSSSRSSLWLSPQDLLFTWLTLADTWHTLNFKWRTIENLQWADLSPAEQAAVDAPDTAQLLNFYLSTPNWGTKRPGNGRTILCFGLTARPFPENFRSLSNAVG